MSSAGTKPTKMYDRIILRRTRHSSRRFASTMRRNAKYVAPAAIARPATVSTTLRNAGTPPEIAPTSHALERNLAAMESGKAGFAFASGMAAIGAIATLLKAGDHVVVSDNTYGGTFRLFDKVLTRYQLSFSYVDTADLAATERAFTPATKMLFVETPTNPIMRITDLRAAAELAHRHHARLVVDNTFASPFIQRPIERGADLVTHSTTKYLNGHSDSVGGIVVAVRDDDIEWLRFVQNAEGAILGPMDSWLVDRKSTRLNSSHVEISYAVFCLKKKK